MSLWLGLRSPWLEYMDQTQLFLVRGSWLWFRGALEPLRLQGRRELRRVYCSFEGPFKGCYDKVDKYRGHQRITQYMVYVYIYIYIWVCIYGCIIVCSRRCTAGTSIILNMVTYSEYGDSTMDLKDTSQ